MKKYIVYFTTTSGNYDKAQCYANSPEEATKIIQYELWNVKSIDLVQEVN